MGDIKKKKKLYDRPKKLFDRARMDEENVLIKRYGLKNKREIWKAKTAVSKLRRRAKELIGRDNEEQKVFFEKLGKMGIVVRDVSDVLALTEESLLDRRLQTFLFRKKMATTVKGARQLIVHKNVLVDGKVVNIPSFVVTRDLEGKITLRERKVDGSLAKPKDGSTSSDGSDLENQDGSSQSDGDLASGDGEEEVKEEKKKDGA